MVNRATQRGNHTPTPAIGATIYLGRIPGLPPGLWPRSDMQGWLFDMELPHNDDGPAPWGAGPS